MSIYPFRILEVDLEREKFRTKTLDEGIIKRFVGGVGVAAKILWDETTAKTDPLSKENPLIFMIGPLAGTDMPKSSRYVVVGISPETGIWGEAHSGGAWGNQLRHAGFEGIIFKGRSERPIYLWIRDGEVEIRDAEKFWGVDTYRVSDLLKKETDEKASVATIGSAGERLVKIAAIMNDGRLGRAAARCGIGALMGFKRIKAIAVKGSQKVRIENPEGFKKSVAKIYASHPPPKTPPSYHGCFVPYLEAGGAPFKNWLEGTWERGTEMAKALPGLTTRPQFCTHCPYSCSESRLTVDGVRVMVWEHWAPMGLQCLIDNKEALQEAYTLCNSYGIDSISTGGAISFAIECFEKGLITERDTGGIKLRWGDHRAMLEIVRKIGQNKGFGKVLGEGVKRAAEQIGGIAREYAIHVKGLSIPAHDPRAGNALALCYATGNAGASHIVDGAAIAAALENYPMELVGDMLVPDLGYNVKLEPFETEGKAELAVKSQNFGCMIDSLVVCYLLQCEQFVQPSHFAELLNCVTGWDTDLEEFLTIGERIFNLKRMINVRRGISRKDDTLPPRILIHTRGSGLAADNLPFLGRMLNEYYPYRGWSEEGIPTKEKLSQLGLQECIQYGF